MDLVRFDASQVTIHVLSPPGLVLWTHRFCCHKKTSGFQFIHLPLRVNLMIKPFLCPKWWFDDVDDLAGFTTPLPYKIMEISAWNGWQPFLCVLEMRCKLIQPNLASFWMRICPVPVLDDYSSTIWRRICPVLDDVSSSFRWEFVQFWMGIHQFSMRICPVLFSCNLYFI
jgi:hypothetical protein